MEGATSDRQGISNGKRAKIHVSSKKANEQRLDRCRKALSDPVLNYPVWGQDRTNGEMTETGGEASG